MEDQPIPADKVKPIELPEPISAVVPQLTKGKEVTLKVGYVFAKLIGSESIVQLSAKMVKAGKYPPDQWEILEGKKK